MIRVDEVEEEVGAAEYIELYQHNLASSPSIVAGHRLVRLSIPLLDLTMLKFGVELVDCWSWLKKGR